jgi:hypothetical protein
MTNAERYEHDRAHDRHPGGHYIGPDRPRQEMAAAWDAVEPLDMPDHYAEADPPDDISAIRGIVLGMGLASLFWLALAGWMVWQ